MLSTLFFIKVRAGGTAVSLPYCASCMVNVMSKPVIG